MIRRVATRFAKLSFLTAKSCLSRTLIAVQMAPWQANLFPYSLDRARLLITPLDFLGGGKKDATEVEKWPEIALLKWLAIFQTANGGRKKTKWWFIIFYSRDLFWANILTFLPRRLVKTGYKFEKSLFAIFCVTSVYDQLLPLCILLATNIIQCSMINVLYHSFVTICLRCRIFFRLFGWIRPLKLNVTLVHTMRYAKR